MRESKGSVEVSRFLILESVKTFFNDFFPKIKKLTKPDEDDPYKEITEWFKDKELFVDENLDNKAYNDTFKTIKVLKSFVKKEIPNLENKDENFMCEFLLWGLSSYKKISITRTSRGLSFSDSFSDYINRL